MKSPLLLSIQVGAPRIHGIPGSTDPLDEPWTSGFFKHPVDGPLWLGSTNLEGDGQADTVNHGGADKAVNCFSAEHYPFWRSELEVPDLPFGAFGENFTIAGLTEADACIGDIFAVGAARVQVSQPRVPCWKLGRRHRRLDLPNQAIARRTTGWYVRVLDEAEVEAGLALDLLERPFPEWTVTRANEVFYDGRQDIGATAALAACPLLADAWRNVLSARLRGTNC